MSVSAGIGELRDGAKQLRLQWGEVQGAWQDENARRFFENHMAPLLARLRTVELAMSQIGSAVQKSRSGEIPQSSSPAA